MPSLVHFEATSYLYSWGQSPIVVLSHIFIPRLRGSMGLRLIRRTMLLPEVRDDTFVNIAKHTSYPEARRVGKSPSVSA